MATHTGDEIFLSSPQLGYRQEEEKDIERVSKEYERRCCVVRERREKEDGEGGGES